MIYSSKQFAFLRALLMLSATACLFLLFNGVSLADASPKKKTYSADKNDFPYIACDVCRRSVDELTTKIADLRAKAPYQKLEELEINEALDKHCDPENEDYGMWIRKLDIITKERSGTSYVELTKPGGVSKCQTECKTISASCAALHEDEIDRDDLAVMLFKNKKTPEQIKELVCNKWSKRCPKKIPLKKERQDHAFKTVTEKELEMEKMMANMKAMGMGGMSMYSREDMEDMSPEDIADEYGGGYGGDDGYGDMDMGGMGGMGGMGDL